MLLFISVVYSCAASCSVCPDKGVVHPFPPSSQTLFRTYHHDLGTCCPCPPLPRPWHTHTPELWGRWRIGRAGTSKTVTSYLTPSTHQPMHHPLRAIASEDQREKMSHVLPLLCGSNRSGASCGTAPPPEHVARTRRAGDGLPFAPLLLVRPGILPVRD
jgi:hypothetical protein